MWTTGSARGTAVDAPDEAQSGPRRRPIGPPAVQPLPTLPATDNSRRDSLDPVWTRVEMWTVKAGSRRTPPPATGRRERDVDSGVDDGASCPRSRTSAGRGRVVHVSTAPTAIPTLYFLYLRRRKTGGQPARAPAGGCTAVYQSVAGIGLDRSIPPGTIWSAPIRSPGRRTGRTGADRWRVRRTATPSRRAAGSRGPSSAARRRRR